MSTHTHYSPWSTPSQAQGSLLDCNAIREHNPEGSELFADYQYSPLLVQSADTGLPLEVVEAVYSAFTLNRKPDVRAVITEAVREGDGFLVTMTMRRLDDKGWHAERYHYAGGRAERVVTNPHPPYDHLPAFCPNCGY